MADVACLGGRYCPITDLAERFPQWRVVYAPLRGLTEVMDTARRIILLDRHLSFHQVRSNLAHAICHIDLEHVSIEGAGRTAQELDAEDLAAARCIDVVSLRTALGNHGEDWHAVAEVLAVDVRMVHRRMLGYTVGDLIGRDYGARPRPVDRHRSQRTPGPFCKIRAGEAMARPLDITWAGTLEGVHV